MKKSPVVKNAILQDDIMRYKKNKFASGFALLGLLFNVFYFSLLYAIHNVDFFYKVIIGGSVILNLLVLLAAFYCSEGIKSYNKKFAIALFVLAGIQIARIFIFPTLGMNGKNLVNSNGENNRYFGILMTNASNGIMLIVWLVASAACFIVSGVQGLIMALRLESFQKKVESGEVVVEDTLKALDAEDLTAAELLSVTAAEPAPADTPVKEEVENG